MQTNSLQHARQLDAADPLRSWRDQFWIPKSANGDEEVYLVGNSLGLQPKCVFDYLNIELEKWKSQSVRGHFESDTPWLSYHELLAEPMASLVGAGADEVVTMNSLTANLHLAMATFYRPTASRHKILIEQHAFPSDHYAVESQIRHHGFNPKHSLVVAEPAEHSELLDDDVLCDLIVKQGKALAVVLLPGVQYYTGQVIDMPRVAAAAHKVGAVIGLDLAHAVGNIPLALHDWDIDFAVWCTYKYLNSGPGSVGGCFIHRRHASNTQLPRLAGWWGHDKATRFLMQNDFRPIATADGWQLSNPPILSLAAIRASLDVFMKVGGIGPLREKSIRLTGYFQQLLETVLPDRVKIITPQQPERRGAQLSLEIIGGNVDGRSIQDQLESSGMMTDWREPNVIRAAPVPLYNSFEEVFRFVTKLAAVLEASESRSVQREA